MLSPRRRQVIIAGLGTAVVPAVFAALPAVEAPQRLVLSGRILGAGRKPLSGAAVEAGAARTATDADGRFVVVTATPRYRVTYRGRSAEGLVSDQASERRLDGAGSWRASIGVTLS